MRRAHDVQPRIARNLLRRNAAPHFIDEDFRAAARRLASRGADLIVLDCIGFTERMKRVFREESGKPVILPRTLLGRVAGELAGCVG